MFQLADRELTGTDGSVLRRRPADLFYIFRFYSIVCFTFVLRDACNLMLVTEWWSVAIQIFNVPTAAVEQKLRSGAIISFILLVFTDWITSTSTQTTSISASICPEPSTQTSLPPSSVECVQFIVTTATTAHKSAGTFKTDLKYTDRNKPVFVDCPEESWTPFAEADFSQLHVGNAGRAAIHLTGVGLCLLLYRRAAELINWMGEKSPPERPQAAFWTHFTSWCSSHAACFTNSVWPIVCVEVFVCNKSERCCSSYVEPQ